MKALSFPALLLLAAAPFSASASTPCALSKDASLDLDFSGVRKVRIELSLNNLDLSTSPAGQRRMSVQHCASDAKRLADLSITAQRSGDTLTINSRPSSMNFNWFGPSEYGYSSLKLDLPANIAVELDVGSGDAQVRGVSDLSLEVGSGDVAVRDAGKVRADVGSGDLQLDNVRSLSVTVGSGDAEARAVQGEVIARVGSGDISLRDIGSLRAQSIGSGDLSATGVRGKANIGSVGSGDVQLKSVGGDVRVDSIGSGGVGVQGAQGTLYVSDEGDLESIERSGIKGGVRIGV